MGKLGEKGRSDVKDDKVKRRQGGEEDRNKNIGKGKVNKNKNKDRGKEKEEDRGGVEKQER